jgi:hypothetical protein
MRLGYQPSELNAPVLWKSRPAERNVTLGDADANRVPISKDAQKRVVAPLSVTAAACYFCET